ncbi:MULTISPECIES: hypothetical protein [unclassified Flavobacterium]|uniref:hypothetical protein n=1 Tax=unclassified Flavobacterium TaxID=196869 RepID=UPI0012920DF8|nr:MULTISPECIES: hypothetical protein [unclassified Flavobacterium]MQP51389.1 hypothetical protein [Flavobacterium sp. LMO9]MQP61383.1 hypothetical protein [Flavobacterium sp. LMO6]
MKLNRQKFEEIKNLLTDKLGDNVIVEEEFGTEFLRIRNTEFWLSVDEKEFIVGFGINHSHFSEDYENLYKGIIQAFNLLTNKVKTTKFIKGNTVYKEITEIEFPDSKLENIGETGFLFYPFWKKTKIKVCYNNLIINKADIVNEVNIIIN